MIKRVVAIGGDRVEMRDKKVYLNGQRLDEPFAVYKRANERLVGDNIEELTVPEGHVFLLGDNRDESADSTTWKDAKTDTPIHFVPLKDIKGRVIQFP